MACESSKAKNYYPWIRNARLHHRSQRLHWPASLRSVAGRSKLAAERTVGGIEAVIRCAPLVHAPGVKADVLAPVRAVYCCRSLRSNRPSLVYAGNLDDAAICCQGGQGAYGYNAGTGEYGDMLEEGILDPAKVTRLALQNAASVAGLLAHDGSHDRGSADRADQDRDGVLQAFEEPELVAA